MKKMLTMLFLLFSLQGTNFSTASGGLFDLDRAFVETIAEKNRLMEIVSNNVEENAHEAYHHWDSIPIQTPMNLSDINRLSSDYGLRLHPILKVMRKHNGIDLSGELGSDIFTIWPGQDGYDYIFQADYIKSRQYFIDSLAELCEYKSDMTIALEYKMKEPRTHSYLNTVGTTLLMAQATGHQNCKLIIDYGHALLGYENPAESVAILHQFGSRLAHIHINDNYRYWDDDMIVGSVRTHEFLEFFYWLRKVKYSGWMTIDQFPYREDGKEAVEERAVWMDYLETLIESANFAEIEETLSKGDGVLSSRLMRKIISKDWK